MIDIEKILIFRRRKGWTQQDLADAVGIHRATVSQLEVGLKTPSLATLGKIAEALDLNPGDLLLPSTAEAEVVSE